MSYDYEPEKSVRPSTDTASACTTLVWFVSVATPACVPREARSVSMSDTRRCRTGRHRLASLQSKIPP